MNFNGKFLSLIHPKEGKKIFESILEGVGGRGGYMISNL